MNWLLSATEILLPAWIYKRIIGSWDKEGIKKYIENTGWLFFGKAFSMLVSFFMVAIIARYLGPENLGKLSYAQSLIAIFSIFASFGIDTLVYRDLVAHPDREKEVMGTAMLLKLTFGTITALATVLVSFFTNDDRVFVILIFILSLSYILQPFGITTHVFNARVKSKYSTLTQITTAVLIPLLKLLVIFFGQGIIFFAIIITLETVISATLSLYFYIRVFGYSPTEWTFSKAYAHTLIKSSLPMLLAGVSGYIFARIDQVMLQHFLNSTSVGLYQGAVQVSELVVGVIPGIIIASVTPALINAKKDSYVKYYSRLRQLTVFITVLSLVISVFIYFLSPLIVRVLYGNEFVGTVQILKLYVWSSVLYMCILILQQHLVNENKTMFLLTLSASTAIINVGLNILLIPKIGTIGAAAATLVSLSSYLLLSIMIPSLRKEYAQMIKVS